MPLTKITFHIHSLKGMDFQKVLCAVLFSFVAGVEGFRLLGSFRKSSSSLRMPMKMTQEPSFKSTAKDIVDMYAAEQQLAGKCAVVTGGNSGIGLETCKALASAGCKVVMCSRDVQAAESAIETELMQPGLGGYVGSGVVFEPFIINLKSTLTDVSRMHSTIINIYDFILLGIH